MFLGPFSVTPPFMLQLDLPVALKHVIVFDPSTDVQWFLTGCKEVFSACLQPE